MERQELSANGRCTATMLHCKANNMEVSSMETAKGTRQEVPGTGTTNQDKEHLVIDDAAYRSVHLPCDPLPETATAPKKT